LEAAAAKVAGSSGSKSTGKKVTRVKKVPVIVSCDGEEEKEEEWKSSSEFEGDKKEGTNNFVDTEGEQDSESTGSGGKTGKEVAKKPLVVTRSQRVVKVGHLTEWIVSPGGWVPGNGLSPGRLRYIVSQSHMEMSTNQ
jgi:hypothetical protein